jgi:hypothetical protein
MLKSLGARQKINVETVFDSLELLAEYITAIYSTRRGLNAI